MLFSFVDGHIYYNNNLIKLRLDLLEQDDIIEELEESDIFDYYRGIIPFS